MVPPDRCSTSMAQRPRPCRALQHVSRRRVNGDAAPARARHGARDDGAAGRPRCSERRRGRRTDWPIRRGSPATRRSSSSRSACCSSSWCTRRVRELVLPLAIILIAPVCLPFACSACGSAAWTTPGDADRFVVRRPRREERVLMSSSRSSRRKRGRIASRPRSSVPAPPAPILMTSFAFIRASAARARAGPGAEMRQRSAPACSPHARRDDHGLFLTPTFYPSCCAASRHGAAEAASPYADPVGTGPTAREAMC